MPFHDSLCEKCNRTFELTMSIKEREQGKILCPKCKSKRAEPLLAPFFTKTSKKS